MITNATTSENQTANENPVSIRIPADVLPHYKLARKLALNIKRAEHHENYLQECIDRNIIPKGLQCNITAQTPETDWTFQLKWEKAQLECSKTLRNLLGGYYSDRVTDLKQRYNTTLEEIRLQCDETIYTEMLRLISNIEEEVKQNLQQRRTRKIEDSKNTRKKQQNATSATSAQKS